MPVIAGSAGGRMIGGVYEPKGHSKSKSFIKFVSNLLNRGYSLKEAKEMWVEEQANSEKISLRELKKHFNDVKPLPRKHKVVIPDEVKQEVLDESKELLMKRGRKPGVRKPKRQYNKSKENPWITFLQQHQSERKSNEKYTDFVKRVGRMYKLEKDMAPVRAEHERYTKHRNAVKDVQGLFRSNLHKQPIEDEDEMTVDLDDADDIIRDIEDEVESPRKRKSSNSPKVKSQTKKQKKQTNKKNQNKKKQSQAKQPKRGRGRPRKH